jgi:hypothetical protein
VFLETREWIERVSSNTLMWDPPKKSLTLYCLDTQEIGSGLNKARGTTIEKILYAAIKIEGIVNRRVVTPSKEMSKNPIRSRGR